MKYKNLAIIAILMVVVQAGCGGAIYVALGNWSDRGAFGDMFGAVAALFSGLAIAFVIYTLRLQEQELGLQRAEIKRIREIEKSKYLQLDLKVKDIVEDYLLVTVTIENRSDEAKEIANTLLLVAPEKERPIESYNLLVKEHNLKEAKNTNDIAEYRIDNPICSDGRFLIPAPFFYLENARIADERLSYTVPIEIKDLPEGMPYSIRLFVREPMSKEEKDQKKEGRLHRTTHDLFIVPYRNN